MPWRLIRFIVLLAVFLVFISLNLENKCDIGFGFTTITGVPVFLTAFFSFFFGMVCAFPLVFSFKTWKKTKTLRGEGKYNKKPGTNSGNIGQEDNGKADGFADDGHYGID